MGVLYRNLVFLLLSAVVLPLNTVILAIVYTYNLTFISRAVSRREKIRQSTNFQPRRILITGVGMTKGLLLARIFYEAGHNVVGADIEPNGALLCGRVSRAIERFYRLPRPSKSRGSSDYIDRLIHIVQTEQVDLWISCSGVATALDDGKAQEALVGRTNCKAIQFNTEVTQMLHEKDSFIRHVSNLGLTTPVTHTVTDALQARKLLEHMQDRTKYIMKPIGVDDTGRGDMTLLPLSTEEATCRHLSRLKITEGSPWILQQFIDGTEYCTHSLIVNGEVKAFVACPSSELLMHYEALPADSHLSISMLEFTRTVAATAGRGFTGHLSFDFLAGADNTVLYPIECNPRCHTAVALFSEDALHLVPAYLSVLNDEQEYEQAAPITPSTKAKYYWVGHDVVVFFIQPLLDLVLLRISLRDFFHSLETFVGHILFWKDGTFEVWDPLPYWWLYHVYWPIQFCWSICRGQKWSRLNVSTTKMFLC